MIKIKNKYGLINIISKFIKWFLGAVILIFGVVVYTPEYNGTTDIAGWKEFFYKEFKFEPTLMILLIIGGVVLAIIAQLIELVTKKIMLLHNDINEKQKCIDNLNSRLGIAISNSIKANSKNKISEVMDLFMSNYGNIISIQLYEYIEIKHKKSIKYEIKPTNYYLTRNGQVANLIHEQYTISDKLVKKYKKIKEQYDNGDEECMIKYIKNLTEQLNNKSNNKNRITEDSLNKYSLLTLATQHFLNDVGFKNENLEETFVSELNHVKRTGFLRGILYEKYFKFIHFGDSYKGKRIYITKCLPIENKKHMFVMIFSPEIIEMDGLGDYLDDLGEKFYKILSEKTQLVYNNIIESTM